MFRLFLFLVICAAPAVALANVRGIFYDGRPLDIHVAAGKITEVIFPEKVGKIVKGGGADSVLIEVLDYSVFILPKNETPADIFVTSVKGESYPLNLIMGQDHEAKVKVNYAFDPNRSNDDNRHDVMDLMKVLLQGRIPAGATVLEGQEERLLSNNQIKLTLKTVFELPKLNGLILTAENLTDNSVVVPIQAMGYPNLLAVTSERDTLTVKGQEGHTTKIYMVAGK